VPDPRLAFDADMELDEVAAYHQDAESGLRIYFSPLAPDYVIRFAGLTSTEVQLALSKRLSELDKRSCLVALTGLEAHFRIDFDQRCRKKLKDDLSRHFRQVAQERKKVRRRARLNEDILNGWQLHGSVPASDLRSLRRAFRFRHWLAHGRYWTPKLGQSYDFVYIGTMVKAVVAAFPFQT